jgi:hypothetical protein
MATIIAVHTFAKCVQITPHDHFGTAYNCLEWMEIYAAVAKAGLSNGPSAENAVVCVKFSKKKIR